MSFYVVPEIFDSTKKVILFGGGLEAMGMIEQCHSFGNNNIIAVVDDTRDIDYLYHIPVYHTDWLKMQENSRYDYIVVTSNITRNQESIIEELILDCNVPEHKILAGDYQIILDGGGVLDISNISEFMEGIFRFSKSDANIGNEIEYIVKKVKNDTGQVLMHELKKCFQSSSSFKEQIICATILMKTESFNSEDMKLFMQSIKKADTHKYASWKHKLLFDIIPIYAMRHSSDLYEEFWIDKKIVLSQLGEYYYDIYKLSERKKGKIVICAAKLCGEKRHISNIVISLANGLAKMGYKVLIVVEDYLYTSEEYFIKHKFGSGTDSSKWDAELQAMLRENVSLVYATGIGLADRLNDVIKKIIEFQPEALYHFQSDVTCSSYVLHKLFPVIFVPTVHEGHNSYFHALAVPNYKLGIALNEKYHFIEDNRAIVQYSPYYKEEIPCHSYTRKQFGLGTGFVVVTVGNRLTYEISDDMVDEVIRLLDRCENMQWLLVGTVYIEYISQKYGSYLIDSRIVYLDYENDLPALFQLCNVYLNPNRAGGGITIAMAMQQRLPIAQMYSISGGVAWTGIENAIKGNMHDVMEYIYRLYQDIELYECERTKFAKIVNNLSANDFAQSLIAVKDQAIAEYEREVSDIL